jgi:hypothetical protein
MSNKERILKAAALERDAIFGILNYFLNFLERRIGL